MVLQDSDTPGLDAGHKRDSCSVHVDFRRGDLLKCSPSARHDVGTNISNNMALVELILINVLRVLFCMCLDP